MRSLKPHPNTRRGRALPTRALASAELQQALAMTPRHFSTMSWLTAGHQPMQVKNGILASTVTSGSDGKSTPAVAVSKAEEITDSQSAVECWRDRQKLGLSKYELTK